MASSVYDISSLYDTYADKYKASSTAKLEGSLSGVSDDASDEDMMNACKEFEKYFVEKVIDQARKTFVGKDEDEEGSEYLDMFSDNFNSSLAQTVSDSGGVGLAQQLYESMKRQ